MWPTLRWSSMATDEQQVVQAIEFSGCRADVDWYSMAASMAAKVHTKSALGGVHWSMALSLLAHLMVLWLWWANPRSG
jgi:hypothetical protein